MGSKDFYLVLAVCVSVMSIADLTIRPHDKRPIWLRWVWFVPSSLFCAILFQKAFDKTRSDAAVTLVLCLFELIAYVIARVIASRFEKSTQLNVKKPEG